MGSQYIIKFRYNGEDITGAYESKFLALDNAQTIARRENIAVCVYYEDALIKRFEGRDMVIEG